MSKMVNRLEPDAKKEPLSIAEIQSIKMGLEEAITRCMRGELAGIAIVAPYADGSSVKTWHAGDVSVIDEMTLVPKRKVGPDRVPLSVMKPDDRRCAVCGEEMGEDHEHDCVGVPQPPAAS